jgi:hypothetical protein
MLLSAMCEHHVADLNVHLNISSAQVCNIGETKMDLIPASMILLDPSTGHQDRVESCPALQER